MDGRNAGVGVLGIDERKVDDSNQASREMTVAEFLDSKIKDHQSRISSLEDIRNNLPVSFLTSGCHRVMAVFKYLN